MKYMQNGGFQSHPLMRLTLLWTLLFMAGLWCTNAFMFFSRMRPTPHSVEAYYLGSSEEYSNPRSAASMLETTHAHLPIMSMVVLLLTHLMIFTSYSDHAKRWLISLSFTSALGSEAASWLVRFAKPAYAWACLKIIFFFTFQGCLGLLIVGLTLFLLHNRPRTPRHRQREASL